MRILLFSNSVLILLVLSKREITLSKDRGGERIIFTKKQNKQKKKRKKNHRISPNLHQLHSIRSIIRNRCWRRRPIIITITIIIICRLLRRIRICPTIAIFNINHPRWGAWDGVFPVLIRHEECGGGGGPLPPLMEINRESVVSKKSWKKVGFSVSSGEELTWLLDC